MDVKLNESTGGGGSKCIAYLRYILHFSNVLIVCNSKNDYYRVSCQFRSCMWPFKVINLWILSWCITRPIKNDRPQFTSPYSRTSQLYVTRPCDLYYGPQPTYFISVRRSLRLIYLLSPWFLFFWFYLHPSWHYERNPVP